MKIRGYNKTYAEIAVIRRFLTDDKKLRHIDELKVIISDDYLSEI